MEHMETRRLIPGSRIAVLFLHGIAGTPNHFRTRISLETLVPDIWSVINVRYPGHGGNVPDFGRSTIGQWRGHARDAFLELAESHEKVLIVGHSMGTLFAMELALEFPEKTAGLFLLNVPLRPWVRPSMAVRCVKLAFGGLNPDRPLEKALEEACGVTPTALVWQYLSWIPRVFELFREIVAVERSMGALNVPCVAWQSGKDELVSNLTAPVLRRSGVMEVRELKSSTHFYYAPVDAGEICGEFVQWLKKTAFPVA